MEITRREIGRLLLAVPAAAVLGTVKLAPAQESIADKIAYHLHEIIKATGEGIPCLNKREFIAYIDTPDGIPLKVVKDIVESDLSMLGDLKPAHPTQRWPWTRKVSVHLPDESLREAVHAQVLQLRAQEGLST